jgi:hypothetical protein
MIETSLNNWYYWYYGNDVNQKRRCDTDDTFTTSWTPQAVKVTNFRDAVLYNARSTAEFYSNKKFGLLFSGGSESELILRAYKEIGKDVTAYIFRYENDINIYDVSYAVTIAESLSANYKIIDFNLKKFYETQAEKISELAQIDRPRALPQLAFLDYVEGIPIAGASDPTWHRPSSDYTQPCQWQMIDWEHDIGWSKYVQEINRPAIMEWFKWTPEIVAGFTKMQWFNLLVNDKIHGKLGTNSTKLQGYKEVYPEMINRVKKTGFEKIDDLINDFEKHLETKYNGLPFRGTVSRTLSQIQQLEHQS